MPLTFDVGMYDAADTAYYLSLGHHVVAVEANPVLAEQARTRFAPAIRAGRLRIVGRAVSEREGETIALQLSGRDLGASSLLTDWSTDFRPAGTVPVPTTTFDALVRDYGVPEYLKVDIEGCDHLCVTALTAATRPRFLSFEAGDDAERLIRHAASVGYTRFKAINQLSFRALSRERLFVDRLVAKLRRLVGRPDRTHVRRGVRRFVSGHSSGPVPWASDGAWMTADDLLRAWPARSVGAWYDIHARAD